MEVKLFVNHAAAVRRLRSYCISDEPSNWSIVQTPKLYSICYLYWRKTGTSSTNLSAL